MLITGLLRHYFHDTPPVSFAGLYLAGVLVAAYWSSWKMAAALAGALLLLVDGIDRFHQALQRRRV